MISVKVSESCLINTNTHTAKGRIIDVTCEAGLNFTLRLDDGEEVSILEIYGKQPEAGVDKFLVAELHGKSSNMSVKLHTKRPKDGSLSDESAVLKDLSENPYFNSFSTVARLIHAKLGVQLCKDAVPNRNVPSQPTNIAEAQTSSGP